MGQVQYTAECGVKILGRELPPDSRSYFICNRLVDNRVINAQYSYWSE
ncbi:hypothetical protein ES703_79873 [subsurface metagenome]